MTHFHLLAILMLPVLSFAQAPSVKVTAEEDVYTFTNPNNGSGPLWAYGSSVIVRTGEDLYVSQMETGEGVPPLCNTRWRLLKRTQDGWKMVVESNQFIQREPCPLAAIKDTLYLSVNDSTRPPGTKYGNCEPNILRFTFSGDGISQTKLIPAWKTPHTFTDHSYRGFATDPQSGQLLLLNIDAKTSAENACLMTAAGDSVGEASIDFPIRACYPQVALRQNAVHVMAVGDIVEPVEEWKAYKFEQTKATWDYVFRILYYTNTPDITKAGFAPPLEIANVDKTAGAISNQDLWISPEGAAYCMYTEREVASALMRDKFFPGKSLVSSLHLAVVKDGAIKSRRVLHAGQEGGECGAARFHAAANGVLYAVLYVSGPEAGNKLMQVYPPLDNPPLIPIPARRPIPGFCLASSRLGTAPSDTIDLFGQVAGNTMAYMQAHMDAAK